MSGDQTEKTIINGNPSQYVKLNVGGHLFHTTIATLTSKSDTMLQAMFSGRMEVLTDAEGMGFVGFQLCRIPIQLCNSINYEFVPFRLDSD